MNEFMRPFQGIHPHLGENTYIDPKAAVIGNVDIGDDSSVWPMAVIRADVNSIHIGKETNIQDAAILHVTHDGPYTPGGQELIIGNWVTIGHQAVLHACTLEDYCLIGIGAIILDKVHVESNVLVGAGSIVPPGKRLKSGYLYLGNPARQVRKLNQEELNNIEYSSQHYIRLKNKYLKFTSAINSN